MEKKKIYKVLTGDGQGQEQYINTKNISLHSVPFISEQNPTESTTYRSDEVLMGVLGLQHKDWWIEA